MFAGDIGRVGDGHRHELSGGGTWDASRSPLWAWSACCSVRAPCSTTAPAGASASAARGRSGRVASRRTTTGGRAGPTGARRTSTRRRRPACTCGTTAPVGTSGRRTDRRAAHLQRHHHDDRPVRRRVVGAARRSRLADASRADHHVDHVPVRRTTVRSTGSNFRTHCAPSITFSFVSDGNVDAGGQGDDRAAAARIRRSDPFSIARVAAAVTETPVRDAGSMEASPRRSPCPRARICATLRSSPTSTTARPRWSTPCSGSPAPSAPTRTSTSGSWTRTTWSVRRASRSSPRTRRFATAT